MAGIAAYKRILSVLERLPVDPSKSGRDLAPYLKEYVKKCYKEGKFQEHVQYWDRQYIALQKIADNESQKKYKRILTSSATGLTAEQCNIALSNEFLEELQQENKSFISKIFNLKDNK